MIDSADNLHSIVFRAAGREEVRRAVRDIYGQLQREIDFRKPLCSTSGRCCRFEEFGHRLFVTTMELATFVYDMQTGSWPGHLDENIKNWNRTGCPFQINGLCGVHSIRPFGCRIFFCDSTSTQWQSDQYERFHAELKRLHQVLEVPYFYVEWRDALEACGVCVSTPQD